MREMSEREVTDQLLAGRTDEALSGVRRLLARADLQLPDSPRAAAANLARARARLRMRGYRLGARGRARATGEPRAQLDQAFAAVNALALLDGLLADVVQSRHLLLALRRADAGHAARGLAGEAVFLASFSESARRRAEGVIERAADLAGSTDDDIARAMIPAARGFVSASAGYFREARDAWREACAVVRSLDRGALINVRVGAWAQGALFYLGELRELTRQVDGARDHFSRLWSHSGSSNLIWLVRDDVGAAMAAIEEAERSGAHLSEMILRSVVARAHIDLYRGEGSSARRRVHESWPAFADSRLLRSQRLRIEAHCLRARCALAAAAVGDDPPARLADAEHDIAEIERERLPWSNALSRPLRAALALQRGNRDSARAWLRAAEGDLDRRGMALHLAATWRVHGQLLGDGDRVRRADRWMRDQGVIDPAALAAVVVPGLTPPSAGASAGSGSPA